MAIVQGTVGPHAPCEHDGWEEGIGQPPTRPHPHCGDTATPGVTPEPPGSSRPHLQGPDTAQTTPAQMWCNSWNRRLRSRWAWEASKTSINM